MAHLEPWTNPLDWGRAPSDAALSRSMRLSNTIALTVGVLALARVVVDLGLRGGTQMSYVHGALIASVCVAFWLAYRRHRLASRVVTLVAVTLTVALASLLLGHGAGTHYFSFPLAAVAWLVLPRRLWLLAIAFNGVAAAIFANAELRLPEVGPAADPALIGYARAVILVTSFAILAGTSAIWVHATNQAHGELERLSRTDGLSGAFNRRWFETLGELELTRARRYARPLTLVLFDIDHFKSVNDEHGHDAGDAVIRAAVAAIGGELRSVDVLARVGGEEFAILLPETELEGGRTCAERILRRVASTAVETRDGLVRVTLSAGVAGADGTETTLEPLLQRADAGLYGSKRRGRDRVTVLRGTRQEISAQRPTGEDMAATG